jgi:putative ATPase
LLRRALQEEQGLGSLRISAEEAALQHLAQVCEGDARRALNALDIAALTTHAGEDGRVHITREVVEDSIQKKIVVYDHDEDGHYDTISAFIKSVRGSDPHAAVYWLAKMVEAGEDPRFIARRLVILASEDIGNADPRGLTLAVSAQQAVEFVGMPEGRIILSQVTTYLATAPKSNAAYTAIDSALDDIRTGRVAEVPRHLKNVKVLSAEGGKDDAEYVYPHDAPGHFTPQEYVSVRKRYYEPTQEGYEATIARRLAFWDGLRADAGRMRDLAKRAGVAGETHEPGRREKGPAAGVARTA